MPRHTKWKEIFFRLIRLIFTQEVANSIPITSGKFRMDDTNISLVNGLSNTVRDTALSEYLYSQTAIIVYELHEIY